MLDQNSTTETTTTALGAPPTPTYCTPEGILFRKALALIEDERDWCIGIREKKEGDRIQFCALGAIGQPLNHVNFYPQQHPEADRVVAALAKTIRATGFKSNFIYDQSVVATFNNEHTHAENMAIWQQCGRENGWL